MSFLPDDNSTDKLLKQFSIGLRNQFSDAELRRFGWFQFRDHDRPNTLVAVELAASALAYLSLDADGSWRRNVGVVTAVIAFMRHYYPSTSPSEVEFKQLKRIINTPPVNKENLRGWLLAIYPGDSTTEEPPA